MVKSKYLIGLAGVAIAAVSLYLAYKKERVNKPVKIIELKEEELAEEKPKKSKPISLTGKPVVDMFDE